MKVAVIPARGGSKRIPRKNIKQFCGKPMLAWAVEAALESECFDLIIVSTDDEEIANVARNCGAQVPFRRPPELSDDYTGTIPVVAHAIRTLQSQGMSPDLVCCIYATAPFLQSADLNQGLEELRRSGADYAFSVTRYEFPIQRSIRISSSGRVEMFYPEYFNTRSQDLEVAFHDAGQFYWGRTEAWLSGKIIFSQAAIPVLLPQHRVQDIDTPEDWERAEWLFKSMESKRKK
jgi:N-acylneuraminate cytidylyltransferase